MAFDGIVVSNIVHELRQELLQGRVYKIYQPEPDELNLMIKTASGTKRLILSASATLPLVYLSTESRNNPMTAPNFCMLLRKYIGNGRIIHIEQPNFERIISIEIEHLDELGDLCIKRLVVEIMGKHSNIILCDGQGKIIDSIKRIGAQISSVREVLPGHEYVAPPSQDKCNPLSFTQEEFYSKLITKPTSLCKAIYTTLTGFSSVMANEICYRAGLDGNASTEALGLREKEQLWNALCQVLERIKEGHFQPGIVYEDEELPVEFAGIQLTMYEDCRWQAGESICQVIQTYYGAKNQVTRIRQKSTDLRKLVSTVLERTAKKYDLQLKQWKDTEKREKYRIYGELLNVYGYDVPLGATTLNALNYYNNEEITIPLDPTKTAGENALAYFAKYNKLKRTYEALQEQIKQTALELEQLKSIDTALALSLDERDLLDIRRELMEYGYIKYKSEGKKKGKQEKSKPLHYISSDGYHIYVGKNNYQNEELTFQVANGNDLWFHAKQMPGSHVIVKTNGEQELPDRTYEEAGRLAAYYSAGRTGTKVDVDYTRRFNLKKTPGGAPGFVIYHTNYSMTIEPDIRGIQEMDC